MARSRKEDVKSKGERQQVILRLVQEHPISRQEVLLDHLSKAGGARCCAGKAGGNAHRHSVVLATGWC